MIDSHACANDRDCLCRRHGLRRDERAAIAAAQDERDEMSVFLRHARDRLGDRLASCDAYRRALSGPLTEDEKTEGLRFLSSPACTK